MSKRQRLTDPAYPKLLKDFYKGLCDEPDFHGHNHEKLISDVDAGDNEDGAIEANIAGETYFEVVVTNENLDKDIRENEKDIAGIVVPRKQKFYSAMEVCNSDKYKALQDVPVETFERKN